MLLHGRQRFTQPFTDLGGGLAERGHDILFTGRRCLLVRDRIAAGAVRRAQTDQVFRAQAGNRTGDHRVAARALADFLRERRRERFAWRPVHEALGRCHSSIESIERTGDC